MISDKQDLTFKPRIFTDNKFSVQTEYRRVSKKANHIFHHHYTFYQAMICDHNNGTVAYLFFYDKLNLLMNYNK